MTTLVRGRVVVREGVLEGARDGVHLPRGVSAHA